jgi:thiol-disulfide isomerase/thioredoxin
MSASDKSNKSFWTPGRLVITLIAVALAVVIGFSSCNSSDHTTNTPANKSATAPAVRPTPGPRVATNAVPRALPQDLRDTRVETLDGGSLRLSDYDNKVVVVNIWATWCGPCRQEMPELVKINSEYKSRGLIVLGLATTYNEHNDPGHVKDYIKSQNVNYKIVWDNGTLAAPLVELVNARSVIPQSFVISRDGHIVWHTEGYNPFNTTQLMREAIEEALNDKGKA